MFPAFSTLGIDYIDFCRHSDADALICANGAARPQYDEHAITT